MTPLEIAQRLIACPSINPMGRELTGQDLYEGRVSDFLMEFFRGVGLPHERIPVSLGRDNIVARWDGSAGLPTVLFDAHQDTVPVDHMVIDPFKAIISEGRLYGRGACDVKGGMAAMLAAIARLVRQSPRRHPTVLMACTCDEELHQTGAADIVRLCRHPQAARCSLLDGLPEMAVVAEPTLLDVVVAHRGATRWKLCTLGKAAHSSDPTRGVNAIYRMGRVLPLLEAYAQELSQAEPHPLCGPPTLSVGRIAGGVSVNTVPAECTIEIDRRVIPGEEGENVIQQVETYLSERLDFGVKMQPPSSVSMPLADNENGAVAERLLTASRQAGLNRRRIGVSFGTHAARYAAAGIPSVVFGPGSVEQAHTTDEWLDVQQLEQATQVLVHFLSDW